MFEKNIQKICNLREIKKKLWKIKKNIRKICIVREI